MKESKLLSGLDSFLLTLFSIIADRLQYIEELIINIIGGRIISEAMKTTIKMLFEKGYNKS